MTTLAPHPSIIGQPEVVEDASTAESSAAWAQLKDAAIAIAELQEKDGSIPDAARHPEARGHVAAIVAGIRALAPAFPHDTAYLDALPADFARWEADGFGVPDFLDSLVAFDPANHRVARLPPPPLFPLYTPNTP